MCTDKDLQLCEHDDLIAEVDRQQNENARLRRQVDRQMETIEKLRRQLAEAQRSGKRQAAPFSKGKRSDKPKRLRATIWLANRDDFNEMNGVWDAWVPEGHAPARARRANRRRR